MQNNERKLAFTVPALIKQTPLIGFLISLCLIIGIDFNLRIPLVTEGLPNFSPICLCRSILIALNSLFFVLLISTCTQKSDAVAITNDNSFPPILLFAINACVLIVCLTSLEIFLICPSCFSEISKEDYIVEWATAILLLVASLFLLASVLVNKLRSRRTSKIFILSLLVLSFLMFLVGMEEISWMQRIFRYKTPQLINAVNGQSEFNLHNIATNLIEELYYHCSFFFLILFPYIRWQTPLFSKVFFRHFSKVVAPPSIIFMSSSLTTFSPEMWNEALTQFTFFITIFILIRIASTTKNKLYLVYSMVFLIFLIICQYYLLDKIHTLTRIWDASEYKEMFIANGYCFYALSVFLNACRGK